MMTLGIDLRCLPLEGRGAGVAHAARELTETMQHMARSYEIELLYFLGKSVELDVPEKQCVRLEDLSGKSLRKALRAHHVDAVFVAGGSVAPFMWKPVYPWVHDISIFSHGDWFPQSAFQRFITTQLFRRGLDRARHVFCVSEWTKMEVYKRLAILLKYMTVTYQGTETTDLTWSWKEREPYAVAVGTIEPRKNLTFLFDIWPEIWEKQGLHLMLVGKRGWGDVALPTAPWLTILDKTTDKERDLAIQQASMLLLSSLEEGFGRTALEGMQMGVPTLVSKRGALPEVVGEGASVVALVEERWVAEIERLWTDRAYAEGLSLRGMARAKEFSWEKTAQIILAKIQADWYSHATNRPKPVAG